MSLWVPSQMKTNAPTCSTEGWFELQKAVIQTDWASSVQIQDTFLKPEGPTDADRPQMSQVDKQHRWMRSCYSNTMLDFMVFACVCCIWAFILFLWQYFSLLHFKMNAVDSTFPWLMEPCQGHTLCSKLLEGFLVWLVWIQHWVRGWQGLGLTTQWT